MKKIILGFGLVFFPVLSGAGSLITTFGTGGGLITISTSSVLPAGTFTYIQSKSCNANTFTGNCAFDTNVTAHSLLIVGCEYYQYVSNSMQVLDNNSNVWSTATIVAPTHGGDHIVGVYYALNANAGATTVTCRDNASGATYIQQSILEYGATASAAFDSASSSSSVAALAPSAGSINTSLANEFVFAFGGHIGGSAATGSGTVRENYANNSFQAAEDKIVATAGVYTSTLTCTADNNWGMIQAAFK